MVVVVLIVDVVVISEVVVDEVVVVVPFRDVVVVEDVDVVDGGMQQLLESHFQLSLDTYRSLQSCAFWHIIVTLEQFPPPCGQV